MIFILYLRNYYMKVIEDNNFHSPSSVLTYYFGYETIITTYSSKEYLIFLGINELIDLKDELYEQIDN